MMPEFSTGHHKPATNAEPKLLMGYEKAWLGLETQRSQTEGVILSQAGGIPVSSEHRRDDGAESAQP